MLNFLKVTPLGGVGEIGSNLIWLQTESESFLIDFGILFPREDSFAINYLIPDIETLKNNPPTHIYFTHGHEDHIGAIAHLIEAYPDIKIYCTPLTHKLIELKNIEGIKEKQIQIITSNAFIDQKSYSVEYIQLDHSIPETHGLFIRHKILNKSIFYASDFKIDILDIQKNFIGYLNSLIKSSTEHTSMIDSTNITNPHKTPTEQELHKDLEYVLNNPNGNCYITLFASNMERIKTVYEIAKKLGRPLYTMGRSVDRYCQVAASIGLIKSAPTKLEASHKSQNKIVIVSGCQADFRSALRKLAENESPWAKIEIGDRVIFSSRTIPGNEKNINFMMNLFTELGAEVITARDYHIHASGHPGQQDLLHLYENLISDYIVPIHGETFFLKRHYDFISTNSKAKPLLLKNFNSLLLSESKAKIIEEETREPVLIHGRGIVIERSQISQRRKLAQNGIVLISLVRKTSYIKASCLGLPVNMDHQLPALEYDLEHFYHAKCKNLSTEQITEEVRIFTRRYFQPLLGYRPIAICHVH